MGVCQSHRHCGLIELLLPAWKVFVKAMNQEEDAFTYLRIKFLRLSETKVE